MAEYSKEFLEKPIKVWQPYSYTSLSLKDTRKIVENIVSFFSLLKKWAHNEKIKDEQNLRNK